MKKFSCLIVLLLLSMAVLTACTTSKKLPEGFTEEEVEKQTIKDIDLASSNNYEGWVARFQDERQSSLTEDAYQSYLDVLEEKGEFREYGKCAFVGQEQEGKKYAACIMIAKYEKGDIQYTVGYDEDMKLVQFTIK